MKLSFLGCGTKGLVHRYGNNSAFIKSENDGINMLLMDCGGSADKRIEETSVLDGVDRVVLFPSHIHPDHIDKIPYLFDKCKRDNIDLSVLFSTNKAHRDQVRSAIVEHGVLRRDITEVTNEEVADIMNLYSIDQEVIRHDPKISTSALIMQRHAPWWGKRNTTVFAADNRDEQFLWQVMQDESLEDLYIDCTELSPERNTVHFPFEKLKQMVKGTKRERVTLMHMTSSLPHLGKLNGFNTAEELLYIGSKRKHCIETEEVKQLREKPRENNHRPSGYQRSHH